MTENTVRRPDLGGISARFAEFDQLTDQGFDGCDEAFQLALDVPCLIAYVEHLEACLDARRRPTCSPTSEKSCLRAATPDTR